MTDIERGRIGGDEDRLPWLEPVEDEQVERGVGTGKLIAAVIVALVAIGLVIGGIFWLRERGQASGATGGDGDLIAAPAGGYKVAPADPGGMKVQGEGDATYAASQGAPVDAAIDLSKRPETPVAGNARTAAAAPTTAPSAVPPVAVPPVAVPPVAAPPAAALPVAPPVATAAAGPAVQLGAFSNEAKAQAAWTDLARRFPALRPLSHSVLLAEVGGKKLYRLRASVGAGNSASAVCRALTSAKESCSVVG